MRAEIDPTRPVADRVLPDGCMDIIVDVGHTAVVPCAVGTMTRPLDVTYSGSVDLFAVRFRPGTARPFLDAAADEMTDDVAPLDALWGGRAAEVRDRLAVAADSDARAAVLDAVLLARLRSGPPADERVLVAAETIGRRHGAVTVEELSAEVGLGRRQLERRFRASVGVPPKVAARVARLRRAVRLLRERPEIPLSVVALRAGYADQPHLTRELRTLAGTTPAAYRARR